MKVIIADRVFDVAEHPLIIVDEGDEWEACVWDTDETRGSVMTFFLAIENSEAEWRGIQRWAKGQVKKWLNKGND